MLSLSIKKLSKQRKIQLGIGASVLLILLVGLSVFAITRNKAVTKKIEPTSKSKTVVTKKAAATTEDAQTELNTINSKTSNLDTELDSASNGLNDQQANLNY